MIRYNFTTYQNVQVLLRRKELYVKYKEMHSNISPKFINRSNNGVFVRYYMYSAAIVKADKTILFLSFIISWKKLYPIPYCPNLEIKVK